VRQSEADIHGPEDGDTGVRQAYLADKDVPEQRADHERRDDRGESGRPMPCGGERHRDDRGEGYGFVRHPTLTS